MNITSHTNNKKSLKHSDTVKTSDMVSPSFSKIISDPFSNRVSDINGETVLNNARCVFNSEWPSS